MEKVESIDHLKKMLSNGDTKDFFIHMGPCKSSKCMSYDGDKFWVLNEIDDTEQELTDAELISKSNIGESINEGVFYAY